MLLLRQVFLPVYRAGVVVRVRREQPLRSSRVAESCAGDDSGGSLGEKFAERHRSAALIAIFGSLWGRCRLLLSHRADTGCAAGARTISRGAGSRWEATRGWSGGLPFKFLEFDFFPRLWGGGVNSLSSILNNDQPNLPNSTSGLQS